MLTSNASTASTSSFSDFAPSIMASAMAFVFPVVLLYVMMNRAIIDMYALTG
jgi:ABC-type glycerol-3-phosphate transport system permease component